MYADTYEFVLGVALGLLVSNSAERQALRESLLATDRGYYNSAGGLYLGLAQQYGDETGCKERFPFCL